MSKALQENGYSVRSTDKVYRGFGEKQSFDFFKNDCVFDGDIITNPPYKYASEFVEKSIDTVKTGSKVAMFLKIQFLESKKRRMLFDKYPPKTIYVFSERVKCAKNGDFEGVSSSAVCYAWFIWEKGWFGSPEIKWL